ncbi:peptidylprolyl isomerase [Pseudomonas paraeruginosa]|uniref:peptidylprolyl isomerase n=2 Tax=Pseudomonas aeruginosa group TaxID=136841 RepID=UPI0021F88A60|nr:peptidylprolyl isomerase [Pseudomonas aeruginosa]UYT22365.1 putative peptidyl-prolyl cis-trans isomerase, PpiC-type [Pseudomonas aeruginosa]
MRPVYHCGGLALALVILAGCGQGGNGGAGQAQAALAKPPASGAAEPAVARLGALQVAPDELKALLAEVPAQTRAQLGENRDALERWMRARLAEKALYEQASAQDWQQRPEVKTLIDAATRQIVLRTYLESVSTVPEDYPSDADLHDAYEANKAQLGVPALYRVSQIFIATATAGGPAEARKRAQELYRQAAAGDFAELARKYSDDPQTARNGGDIGGLLAQAQLLPAIRPALERLKVGEVSEPIQGGNGFHLVKLTERRDPRLASLDEVRERLRASLRAQRQEQIAKAYLDGLVNNATLSIDGALLGKTLAELR